MRKSPDFASLSNTAQNSFHNKMNVGHSWCAALAQGLQLTVSACALLQHKWQSQTRSLWVSTLTPWLRQELLAPWSNLHVAAHEEPGAVITYSPVWAWACSTAWEPYAASQRPGPAVLEVSPVVPSLAPPAVAELLIPTTDSSVASERRSSAMWGARKQVCINSVCHSEVLKCAELTAPRQRKVQIKK